MRHSTWAVVSHALLPNGPGHRLVDALRHDGHRVGFCATPLAGGSRWRDERLLPGREVAVLRDEARRVPAIREFVNVLAIEHFAWQMGAGGSRDVLLVGCDPVAFLEAAAGFAASPVRVRTRAAWFVDWSAQRLKHPVGGAAYRMGTRVVRSLADVTAAISPAAADAVARIGTCSNDVIVLANQPLRLGTGVPWQERRQAVAYVGGLSKHQGVDILLEAGRIMARRGVSVDIIGDGPANQQVARAVADEPRMRFHGLVGDRDALAAVMLSAQVGWALYDPEFAMHGFNDPLKVKDYLAAGMRVISTLPTGTADETITLADYTVDSVVMATQQALAHAPSVDPAVHPMLAIAANSLRTFVDEVMGY